jgi:hypothetical protein
MRPPVIEIQSYTLETINSKITGKLSDYFRQNEDKISPDAIRDIYSVMDSCHATLLVATSVGGKINGLATYMDNAFEQHKQSHHDKVGILKTELVYQGLISSECSKEYLETILLFLDKRMDGKGGKYENIHEIPESLMRDACKALNGIEKNDTGAEGVIRYSMLWDFDSAKIMHNKHFCKELKFPVEKPKEGETHGYIMYISGDTHRVTNKIIKRIIKDVSSCAKERGSSSARVSAMAKDKRMRSIYCKNSFKRLPVNKFITSNLIA